MFDLGLMLDAEHWTPSDEELGRLLADQDEPALIRTLAENPPGDMALGLLGGIDPTQLSADLKVAYVVACERTSAWVSALMQRGLAAIDAAADASELAFALRRRPPTKQDLEDDWAREEVGAALHLHPISARLRLMVARTLVQHLPGTLAALEEGRISYLQARTIADAIAVRRRDSDLHAAYEAALFPAVEPMTVGDTRRHAERVLLALDPVDADRRHEESYADRSVRSTAIPDGMGVVSALLGAEGMLTTTSALNALLDAARAADPADERTADQLRADLFVEVWTALLTGGPLPPVLFPDDTATDPDPPDTGANARRRTRDRWRRRTQVTVTCPSETATREGIEPGDLDGYGPVPAAVIRRLFAESAAAFDGSGIDLRAGLLDPTTGELIGLGRSLPVPKETLRQATGLADGISAAFGTVVPAELLDEGFERYRPSPFLDGYVRHRDRTCTFPGCSRRAALCDVDHIVPWPMGPTSAENLHCLCRRHHRLKTIGLWRVHRLTDGRLTWTAPSGYTYDVRPPPRN